MFHKKEWEMCQYSSTHFSPFSQNFDSLQETVDVSSKKRHLQWNDVKYEMRKRRSVKRIAYTLHTFRFFIFRGCFMAFHYKCVVDLTVYTWKSEVSYTLIMKSHEIITKYEKVKVCKVCPAHFKDHLLCISYFTLFHSRWPFWSETFMLVWWWVKRKCNACCHTYLALSTKSNGTI